jgi:hypothetical protein
VARFRATIGLTDEKIPGLLSYVHAQRQRDPLYVPGVAHGNPLMAIHLPTIDEAVLLCGLSNAFPFTDQSGRWAELRGELNLLPPDAETWSPLSKAFADCPLEFLNLEDTDLAIKIREDGRLASFRDFMRQIWTDAEGAPDAQAFSVAARNLANRLQTEYQIAIAEWKAIKAKFQTAIWRNTVGVALAGVTGVPTIGGALSLGLSFASTILLSANEARKLRTDQAVFRARIPISIFVEVDKRR